VQLKELATKRRAALSCSITRLENGEQVIELTIHSEDVSGKLDKSLFGQGQ